MSAKNLRNVIFGLTMAASLVVLPQIALAKTVGSSSGGYSRSSSSFSRTPSFGGGAAPRTPSFGSGYSRPSGTSSSSAGQAGVSDQAMTRQASQQALDAYRNERERAAALPPAPAPVPAMPVPDGQIRRRGSFGTPVVFGDSGYRSGFSPTVRRSRLAEDGNAGATSSSPWLGILLLLILVLAIYWAWRHLGGDIAKKRERDMSGNKPSSDGAYRPKWFRVGMAFPLDPTPFILAAGTTQVRQPDSAAPGSLTSVESVAELTSAAEAVTWYRLYLPGGQCFFQVHLDRNGYPDECRYFSLLDEVCPASAEEWAFWLDDSEGLLGWPEFQTKNGKVYPRLWTPGATRLKPRELTENLDMGTRQWSRTHQAMLYAAATQAPAPAPQTEYMLLSATEGEEGAVVQIHAGIDVSVSLLNLS